MKVRCSLADECKATWDDGEPCPHREPHEPTSHFECARPVQCMHYEITHGKKGIAQCVVVKEGPKAVEVKPTPTGYALSLCTIIQYNPNPENRHWAVEQVCQAFRCAAQINPEQWAEE